MSGDFPEIPGWTSGLFCLVSHSVSRSFLSRFHLYVCSSDVREASPQVLGALSHLHLMTSYGNSVQHPPHWAALQTGGLPERHRGFLGAQNK